MPSFSCCIALLLMLGATSSVALTTSPEQEIRNLKTELELQRGLAGNSPMMIIQRSLARSAGSRGIGEGDTRHNRLETLQKLKKGTS